VAYLVLQRKSGLGTFVAPLLKTLGGNQADVLNSVDIDSSGNIYVCGSTNSQGQGSYDILLSKYNSSGVLQWQKTIGSSLFEGSTNTPIKVDSSGNIYCGGTTTTGVSTLSGLVLQLNNSGVIQWQRTQSWATGSTYIRDIVLDGGTGVYCAGTTSNATYGGTDTVIMKYNTGGALQWQRIMGVPSNSNQLTYACDVDASGSMILGGATTSTGYGSNDAILVKVYYTGLAFLWQKVLAGTGNDNFNDVKQVNGSGNIYCVGGTSTPGTLSILLAKYNSSGVLQWQRTLSGSGSEYSYGIDLDSSENIYLTGFSTSLGTNKDIVVAKYNTSGTIQWQKIIQGSGDDIGNQITVDETNGLIWVVGSTTSAGQGSTDAIIVRLNLDGSDPSGSGVNWSLLDGTLTDAAGTLTDTTFSLSHDASPLTEAAGSVIAVTSTLVDDIPVF